MADRLALETYQVCFLTNLGDFLQVWLPYLPTIPIYNRKIKAKQIKVYVEKEKVKGLGVVLLCTHLLTICLICLVYYHATHVYWNS